MQLPKRLRDYALRGMLVIGLGVPAYGGAIIGLQALDEINPTLVTSQSQLEQIVEEQKRKLGCAERSITAILSTMADGHLVSERDYDTSQKIGDNLYLIQFPETTTLRKVKHQVSYVCRGHLDHPENIFKYLLFEEMQATLDEFRD